MVCRCFSFKLNATKTFFFNSAFFGRFLTKKQPKLTKNEENWQNPNRLMKFSEIWYVDTSQQIKMLQKKLFLDFGLFWPFFNQKKFGICWIEIWLKTAKIWHNRGPVWLCLFYLDVIRSNYIFYCKMIKRDQTIPKHKRQI